MADEEKKSGLFSIFSSSSEDKEKDEKDEAPRPLLSPEELDKRTTRRLKSIAAAAFVLLIVLAFMSGPGHSDRQASFADRGASLRPDQLEDLGDRSVEHARRRQGLLMRLLCSGYSKARICS
jgi:hypothetical protein